MAGALMPSGPPAADRLATTEIGPSLHDCLAPIEAIGVPIKPALPQCRSDGPAILREDHVEAPRPFNLAEVKFHVITSEQLPNRFHQ
jgi:hypothetical protein